MKIQEILNQIDLGSYALPEFQRGYVWNREQVKRLIMSLYKGYPIGGLLIWVTKTDPTITRGDGQLTPGVVNLILDGQQRITSLGRFITEKFAWIDADGKPWYFTALNKDEQEKFLNTKLLIYVCEGTEKEIKDWFRTINIVGVPLNVQETLNAVYSGPFVTKAKEEFSNSNNTNINKWSCFISGTAKRQDFFAAALEWVSHDHLEDYMAAHRYDDNIQEMRAYFTSVIDWIYLRLRYLA